MARVTVEDCVRIVPNRFDLILTASNRAKELDTGAPLTVDRDNDKNTIVALREIEEKTINLNQERENIIAGMQRFVRQEAPIEPIDDTKSIEMDDGLEQLYSDAEFAESDSFQVVEDLNA